MHYPDSRWRPRCQGKSRDHVSGRIAVNTSQYRQSFFPKTVGPWKMESAVIR